MRDLSSTNPGSGVKPGKAKQLKHLFEGVDNAGMPMSWCGKGEFDTKELIEEVTCLDCLFLIASVGAKAARRMSDLTEPF